MRDDKKNEDKNDDNIYSKSRNLKPPQESGLAKPLQQPRTGPLIISPQKTHPQYQSPLFTKFPAEIRLQVWELVFDQTEIEIPNYGEFELPRCWLAIVQTCRLALVQLALISEGSTDLHDHQILRDD